MRIEVKNITDLQKVIECIDKSNKNIIILTGTLGSGKTTLVKEFAKSKGIKESVTSPTFSLQNVYGNEIYHYDLYNKSKDEFLALGMVEELEKKGYHFLEWGEELKDVLDMYGLDYMEIKINLNNETRIFECQD